MRHWPSPSPKSTIGSGEMTPWSTSSSWQIVGSNSSATSERAMCHPSRESPGSGGNGHAPGERRVRVQEELVHVVVVDHDQTVRLELAEPLGDLLEGAE